MERTKDVVYIPYWIAGMLERSNIKLSEVLDYKKMSQFLSLQEQANLLAFQHFEPTGAKLVPNEEPARYAPNIDQGCAISAGDTSITQLPLGFTLSTAWKKSVGEAVDANNSAFNAALQNASGMSHSGSTLEEVKARFEPAVAGFLKHSHPFITYDVERDVVLVVVYPAYFTADKYEDNTVALLKAVLKVLYAYNTYASVCKTPYFRKYLESLA